MRVEQSISYLSLLAVSCYIFRVSSEINFKLKIKSKRTTDFLFLRIFNTGLLLTSSSMAIYLLVKFNKSYRFK